MATLNFKGKPLVWNHHLSVPYHQLVPRKDKSLTDKVRLDDNLIIHGDNLKALKALLPLYGGKVKCVYIDPPYNTGNEGWVYNDAVNSPMMKEWFGKIVDREDLTRHDKWLCMMTPRLKLLKEMLSDDGVIFVSIDENEQHRLCSLMEEIFPGGHVATFVWTGRSGKGGTVGDVHMNHEYVECFAKNREMVRFKPTVNIQPEGNFKDAKGSYTRERLRQWGQGDRREDRPSMYYPIEAPDGTEALPWRPDGTDGRWRCGEGATARLRADGDLDFAKDEEGRWAVYRKIRAGQQKFSAADSLLLDHGSASAGTIELKEIFGKKIFDTAKPTRLLTHLFDLVTWDDESAVILDAFAGSGSSGQAVLALNGEAGKRRFILIEEQEYADAVTAERVRRCLKGVPASRDAKLKNGLGGGFSFFDLGDPLTTELLLEGKKLPSFADLARYVFFAATGQEFDAKKVSVDTGFIGSAGMKDVFLIYKPNAEFLRTAALTLDIAHSLKSKPGRRKIVFAPTKYLDQEQLEELGIDFAQLPYDLYKSLR
jgi:adenine-specific DNA-methyltransferase